MCSQDLNFETLLNYLRQKHHFDFTNYKREGLMRRISNRMQQVSITDFSKYHDYLEADSEEFVNLFNIIENNFTYFFRDIADWDYLSNQIIPQIIASKSSKEPIRTWSAGCSSGQETYTLAMILAEVLGLEQFRQRVQIYGTDIDQEALNQARQGSYLSNHVTNVPGSLLNKYFERADDRYVFRRDLGSSIFFRRHNMIEAPPLSQIDLLLCRNTLIYFNLEAQTKVLMRFHFSLKHSGFLFLGRSEMAPNSDLFTSLNLQHRIFAKVPGGHLNPHLLVKAFKRPQYGSDKLSRLMPGQLSPFLA
ncbi:MCP methyltransferase, CheR-type with PAS/PAC sensor [Kalymmatonema gypsitolerans NIES-4073]|nr:MCP methyltransferase, CheR-type with PAS/PAC sensor [Scytonema sp. NIES-4073]